MQPIQQNDDNQSTQVYADCCKHGSNVTKIKKNRLRMNNDSDQSILMSFCGVNNDTTITTYLKLKCYKREIQKQRKSTVRAPLRMKVGKARGVYQRNEMALDLASNNCHINTAKGKGNHLFFSFFLSAPCPWLSAPVLYYLFCLFPVSSLSDLS